jgi:hypothetical protein
MLRDDEVLDTATYRRFYRRAKGGVFRSRPHLLSHLVTEGVLTEQQAQDYRLRAEKARAEQFGKVFQTTAEKKQAAKAALRERQAPAKKAEPAPEPSEGGGS